MKTTTPPLTPAPTNQASGVDSDPLVRQLLDALQKFTREESAPAALKALDRYPEPECTDYLYDALVTARDLLAKYL